MTKIHILILAAFVVAFFLPVLALPELGGTEAKKLAAAARAGGVDAPAARLALNLIESSQDGTLVGHEAARFVWDHLLLSVDESNWKEASTALWWNLANPLFALALLLAIGKRRGIALLIAIAATASAARWLTEKDLTSRLAVGYWVWLAAIGALAVHCIVDGFYHMRNSARWT
ncbi:MAG: hypothetical protein H6833_07655 [Planctomycetes bacterium]|nr:hypothetical protein [Planctomycetota bacterium]